MEFQHVQVTLVQITQGMTQKHISHFLKTLLNIRGSVQKEVTEAPDLPKLKILLSWGTAEWLIHHSMHLIVAKVISILLHITGLILMSSLVTKWSAKRNSFIPFHYTSKLSKCITPTKFSKTSLHCFYWKDSSVWSSHSHTILKVTANN